MASIAARELSPENSPEFTVTPYSLYAAIHGARTSSYAPRAERTTVVTGSAWLEANSKSRSSWPGTPMTAPSP